MIWVTVLQTVIEIFVKNVKTIRTTFVNKRFTNQAGATAKSILGQTQTVVGVDLWPLTSESKNVLLMLHVLTQTCFRNHPSTTLEVCPKKLYKIYHKTGINFPYE